MKNKKFLYVLIPAAIIIWGLIIYKIIAYFIDNGNISSLSYQERRMVPQELTMDTFTLLANYSDPFRLDKDYPSSAKKKKEKQTAKPPWPRVTLYGVVHTDQKKNSVASLQINDRNMVMKTGDTCQGIRISKISESSVSLRFHGEKKEISLGQDEKGTR